MESAFGLMLAIDGAHHHRRFSTRSTEYQLSISRAVMQSVTVEVVLPRRR